MTPFDLLLIAEVFTVFFAVFFYTESVSRGRKLDEALKERDEALDDGDRLKRHLDNVTQRHSKLHRAAMEAYEVIGDALTGKERE